MTLFYAMTLYQRFLFRCLRCGALADAKEVVDAAHDEHPVGDGGRRHQDLAHRIRRQKFVLRAGFEDEDFAVFA